jgi:signal transduction histidine kinase
VGEQIGVRAITAPVAGLFVRCSGAGCPANPFSLFSVAVRTSDALSATLALATALAACAAAFVIARRTVKASRLRRRTLAPVCVWTVVAALAYIAELGGRPSLSELEHTTAHAFADPTLALYVWHPLRGQYLDSRGHAADLSSIGAGRAVTHFDDDDGYSVAAAVHDPVLSDDPDVLDAAGTAIRLTLDNARLQTDLSAYIRELEASRQRVAWAADEERRRIEQDLHDGAQQDLIGLRIKLDRLESLVASDPAALSRGIADAGRRIDLAIARIRDLAKGIYPSVLRDLGLQAALPAVARDLPVVLTLRGRPPRFAPEVDRR